MRQIILDTETTGISHKQGHRIIEIGCLEMVKRRLTGHKLHYYVNPDRLVDAGAMRVHGIKDEFLLDKPRFSEIAQEVWDFLAGAELIIHNAPFDLGFLNNEFSLLKDQPYSRLEDQCKITDTLVMARAQNKGGRNSLDALCKRYMINNQHRTLHGALLDSEILADVYLAMTGGQLNISLAEEIKKDAQGNSAEFAKIEGNVHIIKADKTASDLHASYLESLAKTCDGGALWSKVTE